MTPFVLDLAIKSTLLLLLTLIAARSFGRMSPAARHALWTLMLGGLLVLPALTLILPALPVLPDWHRSVPVKTIEMAIEHEPVPAPQLQAAAAAPALTPADEIQPARRREINRVPVQTVVTKKPVSKSLLLALTYAAGAAIALWPLLLAAAALRHIQYRATAVTDPRWLTALDDARRAMGVRRPITLLQSTAMAMPMTWGLLRARVLVPECSHEWSDDRRKLVLMHELAHVKRYDTLTQLFARLVCVVYWMHPLVWLANRQLKNAAEQACDDLVLNASTKPSTYAAELLEIASSLQSSNLTAAAAIAMARPSQLEHRLLAILDTARSRKRVTAATVALLVIVSAGVVAPIAMLHASASRMPETPSTVDGRKLKHPEGTLLVTDSQGNSIAGAEVEFDNSRGAIIQKVAATQKTDGQKRVIKTGRDGTLVIPEIKPGDHVNLSLKAEGFVTRDSESLVRQPDGTYWPKNVHYVLYRTSRLEGVVLGPDGKPMANALLSLMTYVTYGFSDGSASSTLAGSVPSVLTDDKGRFVIDNVPPGTHGLYYPGNQPCTAGEIDERWKPFIKPGQHGVQIPTVECASVLQVPVQDGRDVTGLVIDLSKSVHRITGRVVDPEGKPLADAQLRVVRKIETKYGKTGVGPNLQIRKTDGDGRFTINGLTAGEWTIHAEHSRYQNGGAVSDVNVPGPNDGDLLLRMQVRGETISDNSSEKRMETAADFSELNTSHGAYLEAFDQNLHDAGMMYFMNLNISSPGSRSVYLNSVKLDKKSAPEAVAEASSSGDFYFRKPNLLVPLRGTLLIPMLAPKQGEVSSITDRIRSMTRQQVTDIATHYVQSHAGHLTDPNQTAKGNGVLAIRPDGKGFVFQVDGVDENYARMTIVYVGPIDVKSAVAKATGVGARVITAAEVGSPESRPTVDEKKLKGYVEKFFTQNFRDVQQRETISWGQAVTTEDGNWQILYDYYASVWGKFEMRFSHEFTFTPAGKFVDLKKVDEYRVIRVLVTSDGPVQNGKPATWDQLAEKYAKAEEREKTVLEVTVTESLLPVNAGSSVVRDAGELAKKLGLKSIMFNNPRGAKLAVEAGDGRGTTDAEKNVLNIPAASRSTDKNSAEQVVAAKHGQAVVIKTFPEADATHVNPAIKEIRVTFSKDMSQRSWSWVTFDPKAFPKIEGKIRYLDDKRTCVLPVILEPNHHYALGINGNKFQNFRDAEGKPAVPFVLEFDTGPAEGNIAPATQAQAVEHPKVIKIFPDTGATNVDPTIAEIRVTFSKDMNDSSWSWVTFEENAFPKGAGKIHYLEDKRTCVMPVALEPNHHYKLGINSERFRNFRDTDGRSAEPFVLEFDTGDKR